MSRHLNFRGDYAGGFSANIRSWVLSGSVVLLALDVPADPEKVTARNLDIATAKIRLRHVN